MAHVGGLQGGRKQLNFREGGAYIYLLMVAKICSHCFCATPHTSFPAVSVSKSTGSGEGGAIGRKLLENKNNG